MKFVEDETRVTPAGASTEPLLVSIPEAARRIGVGRTSVYSLLSARELNAVRVGRRRLVPVADLVAYVDRIRAEQSGRA